MQNKKENKGAQVPPLPSASTNSAPFPSPLADEIKGEIWKKGKIWPWN